MKINERECRKQSGGAWMSQGCLIGQRLSPQDQLPPSCTGSQQRSLDTAHDWHWPGWNKLLSQVYPRRNNGQNSSSRNSASCASCLLLQGQGKPLCTGCPTQSDPSPCHTGSCVIYKLWLPARQFGEGTADVSPEPSSSWLGLKVHLLWGNKKSLPMMTCRYWTGMHCWSLPTQDIEWTGWKARNSLFWGKRWKKYDWDFFPPKWQHTNADFFFFFLKGRKSEWFHYGCSEVLHVEKAEVIFFVLIFSTQFSLHPLRKARGNSGVSDNSNVAQISEKDSNKK